jgi:hypothetical protein
LSRDSTRWWRNSRIRAGDRAPDVAFIRSGVQTTLFTLIRSLRPVVLLNGLPNPADTCERLRSLDISAYVFAEGQDQAAERESDLIDLHGDFARLYGFKNNFVCLIRPDGHVGLALSPARLTSLSEYLQFICPLAELRRAFPASFGSRYRGRVGGINSVDSH